MAKVEVFHYQWAHRTLEGEVMMKSTQKVTRDFIVMLQVMGPKFDFQIREDTGEWIEANQVDRGRDTRELPE